MKRHWQKLIIGSILLFGMGSASYAEVEQVDNASLEALMAKGVQVIDVRRKDEWQQSGVIDGAHLLTFFDKHGRYDAQTWLEALDKIAPKGTPFVLICAAGVRSKNIANLLDKRLGYAGVHNHTKGMNSWLEARKPVIQYSEGAGSKLTPTDKTVTDK